MIHVIANIELQPGCRDAFLVEFHKLVPSVVAESGCLEYGPAVDIASGISAQLPSRSDTVVVIEKWESLDHLKAHLGAPHMQPYREAVREMVVSTNLFILEPAQKIK